jgi:hypothetical protein
VQDVLHFSPLKTGYTFIATAGTAVLAAGVAQALTTRFGPKPIIVIGLTLLTGAMIWYSQIPVKREVRVRPLAGLPAGRRRDCVRLRPGVDRSACRCGRTRSGVGVRLDQHLAADRRAIGTAVASTVFASHYKSLLRAGHSVPTRSRTATAMRSGRSRSSARPRSSRL